MYYQVGAFRDEANAKALSAKLLALGLRPTVKLKPGKEVFAVYVEAGKDPSKVVLVLKDSGYEAWAVEGAP
jgi:cell division protein FtsN